MSPVGGRERGHLRGVPQLRRWWSILRGWLSGLSFRTGVVVLLLCVPFYVASFAQALLPSSLLSPAAKGALWVMLFGMAKTCQYAGLTILGVKGWRRLKAHFRRSSSAASVGAEELRSETPPSPAVVTVSAPALPAAAPLAAQKATTSAMTEAITETREK